MRTIAADIKDTLSSAISELHLDIRALTDRVYNVERVTEQHEVVLQCTTRKIDAHTLQLVDMQHHLEDLDNRERRHILRVRGLLEYIEGEQIPQVVTSLFNGILNRLPQTAIDMDRIHLYPCVPGVETRVPQGRWSAVWSIYKLKEDILRQARGQRLTHKADPVQIFQHRHDLKPLLDTLRSKGIQ